MKSTATKVYVKLWSLGIYHEQNGTIWDEFNSVAALEVWVNRVWHARTLLCVVVYCEGTTITSQLL